MTTALTVANHFIDKADKKGITPIRMRPLIYIAHCAHLYHYSEPLVRNELAEAWPDGPVFPSAYHEFIHYGTGAIKQHGLEWIRKDDTWESYKPVIPDTRTQDFLDWVSELFQNQDIRLLHSVATEKDGPWFFTRKMAGPVRNANIPNDRIKEYYQRSEINGVIFNRPTILEQN